VAEIRQVRDDADVAAAARVIARAFQDDPALSWAAPRADRRARFGPRYFELLIRKIYLSKGRVEMTDDGTAAAIWAAPDQWRTSMTASLPLLPVMLRTCGRTLPRAMKMLSTMERHHEQQTEPHWYLPFIGTDPDHRGKGHGTALLRSVLDGCDAEGVPAYLEATSVLNKALYHRHGFEVLDELNWPGGGPPFFPMWRSPR
jgi:ribosomal protein S18 acetylase RimI-like enzyme